MQKNLAGAVVSLMTSGRMKQQLNDPSSYTKKGQRRLGIMSSMKAAAEKHCPVLTTFAYFCLYVLQVTVRIAFS